MLICFLSDSYAGKLFIAMKSLEYLYSIKQPKTFLSSVILFFSQMLSWPTGKMLIV